MKISKIELFDKSGKLICQGAKVNKQKDGFWSYYQNDTLVEIKQFLQGQKVGIRFKNRNGFVIGERKYLNNNVRVDNVECMICDDLNH